MSEVFFHAVGEFLTKDPIYLILGIVVYYFYTKNREMDKSIKAQTSKMEDTIKEQAETIRGFVKVLESINDGQKKFENEIRNLKNNIIRLLQISNKNYNEDE